MSTLTTTSDPTPAYDERPAAVYDAKFGAQESHRVA
jgi:hypothetical protein